MTTPDSLYAQEAPERHTVQSGETLFSISRQYDITVSDLREWNDIDGDNLRSGMELYVAPPEPRESVRHTVEPGETLFGISRQYGVSLAEIEEWNDLRDRIISPGQELVIYGDEQEGAEPAAQPDSPAEETGLADIPDPQEPADDMEESDEPETSERESLLGGEERRRAGTSVYTVQSGDNLNRIANEHGMTTNELRELNQIDGDVIRVGQELVVRQSQSTPVVEEFTDESTPQGQFTRYQLGQGEGLSDLLQKHRMTERELASLNPDIDVTRLSSGQQVTVLLPPTREFENPYLADRGLQQLGEVDVSVYQDDQAAFPTTSGELYNPRDLTAAHANMTLGSVVYVENPENGRGVYVKINDRTPGDGIRLSRQAYQLLGFREGMSAVALIFQEE